jgi:hypothetical protein
MKKLILALAPLACIFIYAPAMGAAARAKVPTNLCFSGGGVTNQLVLKTLGSLKTSGSAVKQYGMFGYTTTPVSTPVQGSGYVIPGLTVLHGTLTASYAVSGVVRDVRMEFFIDLLTQTGSISTWLQTSAGTNNVINGAVAITNCTNLAVTGSLGGEGQQEHLDPQ